MNIGRSIVRNTPSLIINIAKDIVKYITKNIARKYTEWLENNSYRPCVI